ncbi:AAA domain-containing protein [Floridanema aerugineum]|uniref:AAA domain-containing protein n=1 Tax=Floridaenema aerugineum BLCC-F46 TaxID=3153654 RepID=A0ABV4XFA3_9CYAN
MPSFDANPANIGDLLQIIRDGYEINLMAGEYKGPFIIEKAIAIRGNGADTVIFTADEPAIIVKVAGVRIENLAIARTVGGDKGEVALLAEKGTLPILEQVRLTGIAENVRWSGVNWDIPAVLDFGEVESDRLVQRSWQLQIGAPCEIVSDLSWLNVQQNYLSPGLQNIEISLNSKDILPGTNLSGFIFLADSEEIREIEVTATVKATSNLPYRESILTRESELEELVTEKFGYRFVGENGINNLISDLEGKAAIQRYFDFGEKRDRAEELLDKIVGEEPRLFYLRRRGEGQEIGEEKWELTLATDRDDVELPTILKEREKTLNLVAVISQDGYGGLRILSARLLSADKGKVDAFSIPYQIRLLRDRQYRIGIPRSVISQMANVPFCGDHLPTEEQLQAWKTFLNIEERMAKERQFCVPFINHNYGSATRKITFEIDASKATIDSVSGDFIKADNFWQRAAKARNEDIQLLEIEPDSNGEKIEYRLGSVEEIDREKNLLRIRIDAEIVDQIIEGNYQIPKRGFLSFEAAGDLSQIKRKKRALEELQKGNAQNPYLGEFFFDAAKARPLQRQIKLKPENLLLPAANPDQIAAVEAVLSADDLVLIQGPPGTGKTTVIAEICYQIALQGGRTLIASQANLAVDNALSRLIHSPVIRALRKGRAERVEEEGLPFLEEQVIGTWLKNTAEDCEKRLLKRKENIEFFRQLLASAEKFTSYLKAEETVERNQRTWQSRLVRTKAEEREIISQISEIKAQETQINSIVSGLNSLLKSANSVNWENPEVFYLLERLKKSATNDNSLKEYIANVQASVNLAKRMGLVSPGDRETFGLAAWLRDTVPNWVSEAERGVGEAKSAIASINETQKAVQTYQQYSANVAQLQRNYQQMLTEQQNIQTHKFDRIWQQIIENIQLGAIKALLSQHGCLLSYNGETVQIGISSQGLLKLAQQKLPDIKVAVVKVFNRDLKVGLVVGNANSQSGSTQLFNEDLANLKIQMSESQRQLENLRQQAGIKASRCRSLLTELKQFAKLPETLRTIVERCLQSTSMSTVLAELPILSAQVSDWENGITNLKRLISLLDPLVALANIKTNLNHDISKLQETGETANGKLKELQNKLREIEAQLKQKPSEQLISDRKWWESAWQAIPDRLKPPIPSTGLSDPDFLRTVKAQFDAWQTELEKEEAYLSRYENLVQDWIQKLRNPSAQDRTELRRTYIDNANVIGITCVQAAGYSFAREFNNFDVVIIDEVSKCTPPELLIPALKGKKLVLIGDYRQLPPMLHENSIEEIAEEMGSTREEMEFLEESLFKRQFEAASESIKSRLTIQYRMHPIIMGAINQFYAHRLECGIVDVDRQRAHNLNGKIIQENHHLIWVKMPLEEGFAERQEGTSRVNIKEVDAIELLCQEMEAAWLTKVAEGNPRKEIGIITFYGAQLRLIEERINPKNFPSLQIRTGTVDRFQGMERAVVIVSMVRNNSKRDVGFAKKLERVNVAFSRAQELLIVVGCHSLFTQEARGVGRMYSNISDIVRRHGGLIDVSSILS